MLVFRFDIGPLFVHDDRVMREVATVTPICAGYQVPDGIYGVASGVLRYVKLTVVVEWKSLLSGGCC